MITFRPHAIGMTLDESLEQAKQFDGPDEVKAFLVNDYAAFGRVVDASQIMSAPYGHDERIGWDSHIIKVGGHVVGFSNAPLE